MKTYQCKVCNYQFSEYNKVCPLCGAENETVIRKIKEKKDAELREMQLKEELENSYEMKWVNWILKYTTRDFKEYFIANSETKVAKLLSRKFRTEEDYRVSNNFARVQDIIETCLRYKKEKPNYVFFKAHKLEHHADWCVIYPSCVLNIIYKNEQIQSAPKPSF